LRFLPVGDLKDGRDEDGADEEMALELILEELEDGNEDELGDE
jgi:hypothetical protein